MARRKIPANYLDCVPVRRADHPWRRTKDGTVEVDMEHRGFYASIAQRFFHKPRVSHIALDKYGSAVWEGIDGANTVSELARIMEERFPDERERMLDRVVTFVATLQRNGFISMRKEP